MQSRKAALRGKDIRKGNEKLVLRLIQREKLLSQSEVVELTGLKAPTILRIFTNLEEAGLIKVSETPKETVDKKGRKPVYYRLNPEALYVVGVEFWAASATVVISNFIREPVYSNTIEISRSIDGQSVMSRLSELVEGSLKEAGIDPVDVAGIGVGAPGKVDIENGTVIYYSRIKGMENLQVADYLESKLDIPVLVHNNCSVIAMNEYHGNAMENENIMAILIRGGVGGAYINGGNVLTSNGKTAMEIGHFSVNSEGRLCSCGQKGCLETYLSEDAILNDIAEKNGDLDIFSLEEFLFSSAKSSQSELIKEVLDEKVSVLSFAIRNLIHLFSPNLFLIISRSFELSRYLAENAGKKLESVVDRSSGCSVKIAPVCYNSLHAGMGACDIVFQDFFLGSI